MRKLLVFIVLLGGCTMSEDPLVLDPMTLQVVEGLYQQGIEDSTFEPCQLEEVWQITADDEVWQEFMPRVAEALNNGSPVYVRLEGIPSVKGEYQGFFITYDRIFEMKDVLNVRARSSGDCR